MCQEKQSKDVDIEFPIGGTEAEIEEQRRVEEIITLTRLGSNFEDLWDVESFNIEKDLIEIQLRNSTDTITLKKIPFNYDETNGITFITVHPCIHGILYWEDKDIVCMSTIMNALESDLPVQNLINATVPMSPEEAFEWLTDDISYTCKVRQLYRNILHVIMFILEIQYGEDQ